MKLAILYICTGKYNQFFQDFYNSSEKYLLINDSEKHYFVWTDDDNLYVADNVILIHKNCAGFPADSLFRFEMFLQAEEELKSFDYIYFFNANALFLRPVGEEILPNGKNKWTIDRIDVNGNYEPSNCRWVTIKEQSNNKTTNRLLKYNNKVKTISQWSEDTGISHTTICDRLKYGWSVEDALKYKPRGKKTIELNNKLDLLLEYIIGFYKDNKREPSFIEIRDNLSYNKSGSCLCNHLDILEKRGKIKRIKRQKNNIVLGEQDETNRRESSELHQEIPRRTQPNADSARNS